MLADIDGQNFFMSQTVMNHWKQSIRVCCFVIAGLLMLSGRLFAAADVELKLAETTYRIELATTSEQRRLGLMHRPELGPRQGMLLVYPDSGDRRIWMKNVLIPLRVYWIDADFTVLAARRLEPCRASPCEVYAIDGNARYVLELGDYEHPLAPGDRIDGLRDL